MYEDFRLAILLELVKAGLSDATIHDVIGVVDRIGADYEIAKRCTDLVPIGMTGPHMLVEYLACKKLSGLSQATIDTYHRTLMLFINGVCKALTDVQPNDIRRYLYSYQQTRKVSNRSLDTIRSCIAAFFHWATAEGKLDRDPTLSIDSVKYVPKHKTGMSQMELEYLRGACTTQRDRAIVEFLYSTGCRVSELCAVQRSDVDWRDGTVTLLGKGNKYRTAYLNAKACVTLQAYLDTRKDASPFLFVGLYNPHKALTRSTVEKIIGDISDRAFEKTGRHITPHIFRHTTVTVALRNGMPVQDVSRMAGHARIETTMIYADIDRQDVQRGHARCVV